MVAVAVLGLLAAGCGARAVANPQAEQKYLNYVYSQAPDISSYRTSPQLFSLGQAICDDLESGATVEEVGDRVPLVEGNVSMPPTDLGVVISSAVGVLCPKFHKLLSQ